MWNKIQRIYIGQDLVRPSWIHINSDLRWATLAWLQAQWWTGIIYRFNSYILDSNWLSPSWTNNDVAFIYKNIPQLDSNNKIEINLTGYLTNNSTNNAATGWAIASSVTTAPWIFQTGIRWSYTTWPSPTLPQWIIYNDTWMATWPSTHGAWNLSIKMKINLSTGLVEYNLSSPVSFSTSYTLSSSQLQAMLTYKNIGAFIQTHVTGNTARIYTVSLTVE